MNKNEQKAYRRVINDTATKMLMDIAKVYGGLTIDNIIQQIESRLKELGNAEE